MRARVLIAVLLVSGTLWYLRDPAWLATQTTGLRGWQRSADGTRYRWSGGHASFFVPSDARTIKVPVATTFDAGGAEPMVVTFSVDGRRAARVLLAAPGWQEVTLPMPSPGSRRVRRVDVQATSTREGNRGVQLGELQISR
ncbi:MAG: hypothetical protein ABIQ52_10725 [Vicinamibacterales bacterium]